jgi:DNA-binding transcriptional LysR family regulator
MVALVASTPTGADRTMSARPAAARRAARPIALAALRGFESAARHLSFTLAAVELNLTQSSISRQIASLERQVGKPLFVRRTRALELTPAGERLYAAVRQSLGAIDRCEAVKISSRAARWLGARSAGPRHIK